MRFLSPSKLAGPVRVAGIAILSALLSPAAFGQAPELANPNAPTPDAPNLPPRATPGDYQAHAQAGDVTIAAEFMAHNAPTPQAILSTEDYVVVEVGFFGRPNAHLMMTFGDFSLRINGKKAATPAQPYGLVFGSLKDPEWEPPEAAQSKSKTSLGTGGGGQNGDPPPLPPKMPIGLKRQMQQRLQRASLPEGDRPLPEAGLLYFPYHGKAEGIRTVELVYSGPAGKVSFELHP